MSVSRPRPKKEQPLANLDQQTMEQFLSDALSSYVEVSNGGGTGYKRRHKAEFFLFLKDLKKPWFYRLFKSKIDTMLEQAWLERGKL